MYKSFRILLALFLFMSHVILLAQGKHCSDDCSCIAKGQILDANTEEPLPYATVQLKGTTIGVVADENGNFILQQICDEEFDIIISSVGYKTLEHHHDNYHEVDIVYLAQEELFLESVVIQGKKENTELNSSIVSSLSGKDLMSVKNESLGEVLTELTGVSTLKNGQNVVKPIIHGLHSNRVLIINNGVRHEGQEWGQEHAPEIDPSLSERITLVKGASSVKYGPNALGGVILIDPPTLALNSHLHGEIEMRGESNGNAMDGAISLQKGYNHVAFMTQASGRFQGDLQAPDYILSNTGMREYSAAFGARYHRKHLDMNVYLSSVNQELGILRGSVVGNLDDLADAIGDGIPEFTSPFTYTINNPRQVVGHNLMKFQGNYNMHNSFLQFTYAFQQNKRQEFDVRRGTANDAPSIDLKLNTHTLDIEWIHPKVKNWEGSIGTQWLFQNNSNLPGTQTISFIPNFNTTRLAVFVIEEKSINKTTLEVGVRYDYQYTSALGRDTDGSIFANEFAYNSISGIVGLNRPFNDKSTLRINASTAWRAPNVAELYSFGKHGTVLQYGVLRGDFDQNGDFFTKVFTNDEKVVENELGYKLVGIYEYTANKLRAELVPYINYISNYFYKKPSGITTSSRGAFPFFVYQQTNVLFAGVDATLLVNHNNTWKSKLSGTYLFAKDIVNNDFLLGIPANKVGYALSFTKQKWFFDDVEIALMPSYTFEQKNNPQRIISPQEFVDAKSVGGNLFATDNSNFDFLDAPKGYWLVDVKAEMTLNTFVFGLKIKNALNTNYRSYTNLMRYYADEMGFNAMLYVKLQL
ncbi:MAG: carboxypeptidase-like regulatory domain-containing protein [Cyclobacteriaceae bacterium]|nr:carboxypeptidase-like regulatory domain-containing protein [Cyclobacteriaceae bacterium]